jgi:hypothetical protein
MYFELTAPNKLSFEMAYWDAQIVGLDPHVLSALTFNVGTGSIEKVSKIRDKHNLIESYVSDYEPTGYTGR